MNAIVKGSMGEVSRASGKSLASVFLDVEGVVIVDTSGSMSDRDSTDGRSRYEQACLELERLQNDLPGKLAVLSFSDTCEFCPDGAPTYLGGGTRVARALEFALKVDVPGVQFFLISDGEPHDEADAFRLATKFKNRIDTIYVGPEARPHGREFLRELSKRTGGQSVTSDRVANLADNVNRLLVASA